MKNKKYITTSKHSELKEGIILYLDNNNGQRRYISETGWYYVLENDIKPGINSGFIKEVEEKEFTKSDMLSLHRYILYTKWEGIVSYEDMFDEWFNNDHDK